MRNRYPVVGISSRTVTSHQRHADPGAVSRSSVKACSPSGVVRRKIRSIGSSNPARTRSRTSSPIRSRSGATPATGTTYRTEPSWWSEDERNPVGQPFTAPDVRPPTMYFCIE